MLLLILVHQRDKKIVKKKHLGYILESFSNNGILNTMRELYFYNAEVTRIVDGDTIDVIIDLGFNIWIKERLRLYGLNTPETRTKDAEEKEKGLKAKKYVENQINSNSGMVQIQSFGKGKYGRVLAEVWVGKSNLNEALISNGHAEIYMTD